MTHKKYLIFPVILLSSILLMFQNCGTKANTNSFSKASMGGDFDAEDAVVINVDKGKRANFTIPSKKLAVLEERRGFKCEWHFKAGDGEVIALDNSGYQYAIPAIQNSEAGRYRMSCTNGKTTVVVIFAVIVRDLEQSGVKAELTIKIVLGSNTKNQAHASLTSAQAMAKCNEEANKASALAAVLCTWNGTTLYSRTENTNGDFIFQTFIVGKVTNEKTQAITNAEAVSKCNSMIVKLHETKPNAGYKCLWRNVVFKQLAEKTPKGILLGYLIKNKVEADRVLHNTSITEAAATAACKTYADADKNRGVVCYWNGDVVFRQLEPIKRASMNAYFVMNLRDDLFASTANLTEEEALARCNVLAATHKSRAIRCYWGSKLVLIQFAGDKGTYVGKYRTYALLLIPQEQVFQTPISVTQLEAWYLCERHIAQHPGRKVRCYWNNNIFKDTY